MPETFKSQKEARISGISSEDISFKTCFSISVWSDLYGWRWLVDLCDVDTTNFVFL